MSAPALWWYIDPDGTEHGPYPRADLDEMDDARGRPLTDDEMDEFGPPV